MEKINKKRLKLIMLTSMVLFSSVGCNSKKNNVQIVYHETMQDIGRFVVDAESKGIIDASADYIGNVRNEHPFVMEENIAWNRTYADSYNNHYDELEFTILQFDEGYSDGEEQGYNDAINNLEKNEDSYEEGKIDNYILGYKQGYNNGYIEGLNSVDSLDKVKRKLYR